MTDNIRPIRVHPKTAEVMREIGMALTDMTNEARVEINSDEVKIFNREGQQTFPDRESNEDEYENAPSGPGSELERLEGTLDQMTGIGPRPVESTVVEYAIITINRLLADKVNQRRTIDRLARLGNDQRKQIRKARKALKPKE